MNSVRIEIGFKSTRSIDLDLELTLTENWLQALPPEMNMDDHFISLGQTWSNNVFRCPLVSRLFPFGSLWFICEQAVIM